MTLKQELVLDGSPRAAAAAREWVSAVCEALERQDLSESAVLGVSELVTNAILHGAQPITLRIRGTATHPRIEVQDASRAMPVPPSLAVDPETMLDTFGRGLSLVAKSAVAWGATPETTGKTVWFEPSDDLREDDGAVAVIDEPPARTATPESEAMTSVELLGIDVELFWATHRQYLGLRRELRLLSLAHETDYPLATELTKMITSFERQFPARLVTALHQARQAGESHSDVTVRVADGASPIFELMLEMADLADAFCRAERLLSLQRTSEERSFNTWLLGEFMGQVVGMAPTPWASSAVPTSTNRQVG